MAWVKVRVEGEQQGRILATFALMGVPKDRVRFYQKDRGEPGWLGYASVEVHPPAAKPPAVQQPPPAEQPPPNAARTFPRRRKVVHDECPEAFAE